MSEKMKTLLEIQRDYFTPCEVAKVLGCDPHGIRLKAKNCPETLGFPVIVMGNRVKIPRVPFLRMMGIEEPEVKTYRFEPKY